MGMNVGFLLLGIIGGILALIGLLDAVKGTPVKRVLGHRADIPSPHDAAFEPSMELATRTELSPGNHAEYFWNGDQTYPRLFDDLRNAKESITLLLYYNKDGRMADILAELLTERAQAGIDVLFLYDAWGTSWKGEYIARLRRRGVRIEKFRPIALKAINSINHRSHIRVVCVDGRIGWTGGFGIDDKWFGGGRAHDEWRDTNVRFTGPAVAQLQAAFTSCWAETTGELLVGRRLYPGNAEDGGADGEGMIAGVLHGSPSVGSTEAERFFALSIASARKSLYITNSYFVPDRDFRRLIEDAARRGVDVRILTVSDRGDVKSTWYAGRARYEELLRAGVRVFEYQPTMMHAKTIVVDGRWCGAGSMNADNRSLSFNEETVFLVLDERAASVVERHFMDDLQHSKEIKLAEFEQRGRWERLKENACYAFWRIL
jgi:cardiolipin synthase A/B